MAKSKRTKLIQKADGLWSKKIRERDGRCVGCGGVTTQAAHIFSRSDFRLRFDLNNGLGSCYYCHIHRWHRSPAEFVEMVQTKFPDRWRYLQKKRKQPIKPVGIKDLEEIIEQLQ